MFAKGFFEHFFLFLNSPQIRYLESWYHRGVCYFAMSEVLNSELETPPISRIFGFKIPPVKIFHQKYFFIIWEKALRSFWGSWGIWGQISDIVKSGQIIPQNEALSETFPKIMVKGSKTVLKGKKLRKRPKKVKF